jgi:hypothetical protein
MSGCKVTVCRGCCCGQADPRAAAQLLAYLRSLVRQVRIVDCLGPCDHRDVVVVSPDPVMRKRGIRPIWLGWITHPQLVDDLATWVRNGGPGRSDIPEALELLAFRPAKGRMNAG